ncbi:MAG: chemotaxis protein CheD [Gammaproteobacteria bacterium]|nr:chemotaxis protein CheD [Gammaproteobacteria bacterium]
MKHGIRKVFLHPGDFVFGEPGTHIHTVLGSCIAICLWHPQLRIGGMCHFVLPSRPSSDAEAAEPNGRYGNEAMQLFDMALKLHQTEYTQYQAKIFGGANMLGKKPDNSATRIGEKNAAKAMQLLMERQASVEVVHVGERGHRRIVMDVTSGDVWVKYRSEANEAAMASQSGIN